MNKSVFAILAALATTSILAIGCGTTADYDETEGAWSLDSDITESEPVLGASYLESEPGFLTETQPDQARKPKTIENDLLESEPSY